MIAASANAYMIYGWNGARNQITEVRATKTLRLTQMGAETLYAEFFLPDPFLGRIASCTKTVRVQLAANSVIPLMDDEDANR